MCARTKYCFRIRFLRRSAKGCVLGARETGKLGERFFIIRYSRRRGERFSIVAAAVVLFDIDGTLIRRAGPHHRQALEMAIKRVTGHVCTTEGIPVQGMLDGDILIEMLRRAGVHGPRVQAALPAVMREAQRTYLRMAPRDLHARRCPGARAFLQRLRRSSIPSGLVTGNLSLIGWRKMESAGLRQYFQFGAFAEMGKTRADLAKLAIAQARRRGWLRQHTRLWLVGDHPNDVNAARANSIRSIAVKTGLSTHTDLAEHKPDLLLEDLRALDPRSLLT
jgi:phosphoglycolate phosphatase